MRGLYIKYGIRLLLLIGILLYLVFTFGSYSKKNLLIFGIIYIILSGRVAARFWEDRRKIKLEQNQDKE
ncbi:MAG TPA: hypothetical protein VHP30_03725 [Ignavibacteriales bacterium]|nr:hypothetical protein [Ignavibacteriales bacterium]